MKNLIILLFLSTLFLTNLFGQEKSSQKSDHKEIVEEVLQKSLEIEYLSESFKKDENGEFLPVVILSNGFFPENLELEFQGQTVQIIQYEFDEKFDMNQPFLDVTKLKIKSKRSDFEFKYCGSKYSVELKKRNGIWKHRETTAKGNGNSYVHVEF